MRYTIATFWIVYLLCTIIGAGMLVYSLAKGTTDWLMPGLLIFGFSGVVAFATDWLHERYVRREYTRWD